MKIKTSLYALVGLIAMLTIGCNSPGDAYDPIIDSSGVYAAYINSFQLAANDKVLEHLDTVFFSIDLDNCRVFNADSLPKGTDVSKLVVKIGLPSVREAKLIIPPAEGTVPDTINYLTNSTDSVCFARGPVTLRLVSINREVTRDYEIKVNVHNEIADTLFWNQTAQATLPGTLSAPTQQGTVKVGDQVICFTTDGSAYSRAVATDIYAGQWETSTPTLPAGARLATITAAGQTLFMLTDDGSLYDSTDLGMTWTATGTTLDAITGANADTLLGLVKQPDGSYSHVTYPATTTVAADADFPVMGFSQSVQFTNEWSSDAMTVITGGVNAAGDITGASWGYSGGVWAKLSIDPIPDITGLTLIPYFTISINNAWVATNRSALLAFGGMKADGTMNTGTYVSYDQGLHWKKSGQLLNLPAEIAQYQGMQGVVVEQTLPATPAPQSAWSLLKPRTLPAGYVIETGSRATAPIEEWQCPYIYLFGGFDAQGNLNTNLWRGVINRLSFKPLQ